MNDETGKAEGIETTDPGEELIDEPVMDGADEVFEGDEDPRKGQSDPALIRHPAEADKTISPYNL